jgi:hypothetical protein
MYMTRHAAAAQAVGVQRRTQPTSSAWATVLTRDPVPTKSCRNKVRLRVGIAEIVAYSFSLARYGVNQDSGGGLEALACFSLVLTAGLPRLDTSFRDDGYRCCCFFLPPD